MTKKEFKGLANRLAVIYPDSERYFKDTTVLEEWFRFMEKMNPKYAEEAVDEYIEKSSYAPRPHDIIEIYDRIIDENRMHNAEIKNILDQQISYWPCVKKTSEMWSFLIEMIKPIQTWEKKKQYASLIANKIFSHVRESEKGNITLEPDIMDYLGKLRDELRS